MRIIVIAPLLFVAVSEGCSSQISEVRPTTSITEDGAIRKKNCALAKEKMNEMAINYWCK